jgi:prolyl-tRNA synthetase
MHNYSRSHLILNSKEDALRLRDYFLPTSKEIPKEAQEVSHMLLLKSGLIKPLMSGIYEYLPLGLRVITKIQAIIREEMNRIGGQELLLPVLSHRELWEETNRWDDFGDELFKLRDRNDRDLCLAPTHEEIITDLARREIQSYRELPQIWYQIQTKFRDEPRPRGAVLRMRQFIMKDSYTLDRNTGGLDRSFDKHREAYTRIFKRCGLDVVVVGASSGLMGGAASNEFMFLSDSGEDSVARCDTCSYAANVEVASTLLPPIREKDAPTAEVHTPVPGTVDAVSDLLKRPKHHFLKSLLFIAKGKPVFVLVRGDHEVNETKLTHVLGFEYRTAQPEEVRSATEADIGYISPVGIEGIPVFADKSLKDATGMVTGANKNEFHLTGVSMKRDIPAAEFHDLMTVNPDDPCPACDKGRLRIHKAIELGHLFKLGTKYSKAMKCLFTDSDGTEKPIVMGSYGIGIERIMAAIIDAYHDEKGIIWPISVAPFIVHIIAVDVSNEKVAESSNGMYEALREQGIPTLLDDRDERPGFKFNDADLIGIPIHIIIGERSLQEGCCEVRLRKETEKHRVKLDDALSFVQKRIAHLSEEMERSITA